MNNNGLSTLPFAAAPPRPPRHRLAEAATSTTALLRKRLPAIALAAVGLFAALATAQGQAIRATPDDNVAIGVVQGAAAGGHAALVAVGLAPGPLGTPAEIGALSLDIVLKSTPAILEIPADIARSPNARFSGSSNPYSCVFRFSEPVLPGDSPGRLESGYEAIFFIPYNPLDDVFGDLGVPTVYHPQADIAVDVHNPYLGIGALSGRLMLPEFPEGHHSLDWRAGTSFNAVLDVALPGALIAVFAYAEGRITAKVVAQATKKVASQAGKKAAAEAASRQADHLFTLVRLAQEAGLVSADITSAGEATAWYEATTIQTAVNEATQVLTVWDTHAPYLRDTRNGTAQILAQDIVLEATDFGGVSFGRVEEELRSMFEPVDDCGKLFETTTDWTAGRLLPISDTPSEIEWVSREVQNGPYRAGISLAPNQTREGEGIATKLVQRVLVRDTQAPILVPPPGFARYSSTPVDLTAGEFPLGMPRVVDLADPSPSVTNDAPDTLEVDRRHVVNWRATDATGNATRPGSANPEQYVQVVTIKSPGTNTAPSAGAKSAATLTSRPVEIELTGTDADLLDGRVDPLAFEIRNYPTEGSFEAPLYPFFIEDFRLSPVGEQETTDGLTRTSPLGALADAFRLRPPNDHAAFLIDEICNRPARAPFNGVIPIDFVYQPTYIHVDDDGFYYVRDGFWVCGEPQVDGQTFAPMHAIPRLSKWNEAGELVDMRPLYPTVSPLYDDTNLGRNMYPRDEFSVDSEGRMWIQLWAIRGFFNQYVENYSLSPDLEMRYHGAHNYLEHEVIAGLRLLGVTGNLQLGVIYELHGTSCRSTCSPETAVRPIVVRDGTSAVDLAEEDGVVGRIPLPPGHTFGGTDLRSDSEGNVYVVDPEGNRVHKFSPTHRDGRGEWVLGEYIGWLGSCTTNLQNEAGVPFSDCDEERGISKGYACTDFTCARAADTSGSAPGQFDTPGSIVIDPRDVLYVGDLGNSRVQRFGPDGTFAGVAESTGTGINAGEQPGFILGNFGQPEKLAANSSSLYVFDGDPGAGDHFLHVFKTLPFYDVTDASARVKYVSDFDFQGRDGFTYVVDDGIDESAPAPVDVTVTRAFRPPERLEAACFSDESLDEQVPCTLEEDTSLFVRIGAYDPDGFVSTGGLDTLSFEIDRQPQNGTLERLSTEDNSATWRYTPRADFHGEDTFAFSADDGTDTTAGGKALLTVTPVPDLAAIDFGASPVLAGRGFRRVVTATYSDADADEASNPALTEIDWGDGVTASAPGWQNSGRLDRNGREIDPQEALGIANGMLVASHAYLDTGDHALSVRMTNRDGGTILADSFEETVVRVIEATRVSAALALPANPIAPDTTVPARIDVTNHVPTGWAGLVAGDVRVSITVPHGLAFTPRDGRCTAGEPIVCSLGDLAQGETVELPFEASIALADARIESDYVVDLELTDEGPHFIETNVTSAVVGISDRDGDGTIDVDDAFAADDRYVVDTDGDGLADAWELAFGYDPGVLDDTAADVDGDGFTLLDEFANGSYPWLADEHGFEAGERLEIGEGDDRFGGAIAGGDLNGDGYADTVIGASSADGGVGAAYIAYGSANGANPPLATLAVPPGLAAFGSDVAVGDFDGNGWPDIAIASTNAVSIHFNNGEILAVPDLVLEGDAGRNFTFYLTHLTVGDLDGDGADDLVVGEQMRATGSDESSSVVSLYLSTRGGVAGEALVVADPAMLLGRSAAISDIDGDGRGDLLLGNEVNAEVLGFLGAGNDWSAGDAPVVSFRLSAGEPSGYGLLFGAVMTSGADIGGDGIDDLVVTAWGGSPAIVYVFDSTTAYWDVATSGARSTVAPSISIDGTEIAPTDHFGISVALAELDADLHADLVVGAFAAGDDEGEVRVFRGGDAGGGAAILDPVAVFRGATPGGQLGWHVAVPGDIDGDRFADIAAGAPDRDGEGNGGYVQIYRHVFAALDPDEDPDGDGVGEAFDNCPADPNTDQADVDGDAEGNVCDTDADGDGFPNENDNCPLVASADQRNTDGDGLGDLCDPDDDNDGVDDIDDAFPLQHEYTSDTDEDGLPDEYEVAFGLDGEDAGDAAADLDGDGRSNLDEFLGGFDVEADDVAPALTPPADVTADSIGAFTNVTLGTANAVDLLDGDIVAVPDDPGPFAPGPHVVTWRATDAAGNAATATQNVAVIPQVNFVGATVVTAEGASLELEAATNGTPVATPVTIPYAISGTAGQGTDFELPGDSTLTTSGGTASTGISIFADTIAEGEETIVFTMGTPVNAVRGTTTEQTIRIVEGNVAPRVRIDVQQNGTERSNVFADDGEVTMVAVVDDPNPDDTHSIDWSATDGALVPPQGLDETTFAFDPAGLTEGVYLVRVDVSDSGTPATTATFTRRIRVRTSRETLPAIGDADRDGIADAVEGLQDANRNGVDDRYEPSAAPNVLVTTPRGRGALQAREGLALRLGGAAFGQGEGALVTIGAIQAWGAAGGPAANAADDEFEYDGGIFDFELTGLALAGESTGIVLALERPIPADASYRKYVANAGWQEFVTDEANALASAPGAPDACPAPGSAAYTAGLTAGHWCVELTIEDGGPNDADGAADRAISDPGGVAAPYTPPVVSVSELALPNRTISGPASDVAVLRFRLDVDDTDAELGAITLDASGTGNDASDIETVRLWLDANGDGTVDSGDIELGTGSFAADDGTVEIRFTAPIMLDAGHTDFIVSYDF